MNPAFPLQDVFWAWVLLGVLLTASQMIRQNTPLLRRIFIPSSVIAGLTALLLGPEVLARSPLPDEIVKIWSGVPGLLINVVFAALLMGKPIPAPGRIWRYAGPQICFGQTLAWGQYVVGILLTLFVLGPLFGLPPAAGALIEIAFEGGHGTAAGMGEAFEKAGWLEGRDLSLGLATVGLVSGVVIGTILINWAVRRGVIRPGGEGRIEIVEKIGPAGETVTEQELDQYQRDRAEENQPTDPLSLHLGLVALAIALGWVFLEGLRRLETLLWARGEDPVTVFTHVPLFPLAMIGGVVIQAVFDRLGRSRLISERLMNRISGAALDLTNVAALGSLSIQVIGENLGPFLLLAAAGIGWGVFGVLFIAPRMIPTGWFERGVGDFGQSLGVTVTGLLLMRVADPRNESGALESFGYKQLLSEPIVGGGLFTGVSVALLTAFGSGAILAVTASLTLFWIVFGLAVFGRAARENRAAEKKNSAGHR